MQILPPATANFGFFNTYFEKAPQGELIAAMQTSLQQVKDLAHSLSEEELAIRYAPEKWSVKEHFAHLVDAERQFCYRIMRMSRGDQGILPPFDVHNFVLNANAAGRSLDSILEELALLRGATIHMFRGMTPAMIDLSGPARDAVVSVRALGFIMLGHVQHHIGLINEKYLNKQLA